MIDFLCLIIAAYGFWVGYSRGIIQTVFTIVSLLFGVIAALKYGHIVAEVLADFFPSGGGLLALAGVVLTFVLTMAIFRLISRALEGVLESININFINQILGGALTSIFFVFIFSVLLQFADRSGVLDNAKQTSITYELLEPLPDQVYKASKRYWPFVVSLYDNVLDLMDQFDTGAEMEREERDSVFDVEEESI